MAAVDYGRFNANNTRPLKSGEFLKESVRRILQALSLYAHYMPGEIHKTSLGIVLKLFLSGEEGESLFVKQVMSVSNMSSTAMLRRIEMLEKMGIVRRTAAISDNRRVIVTLTERGRNMVVAMVYEIYGFSPSKDLAQSAA